MVETARNLLGFKILATDGEIGAVQDLYFDDVSWIVRYLVADTGGWLTGRKVLISPVNVTTPDWRQHELAVRLTREQVENSPPVDADKTVSRQHETELAKYYGWPAYWSAENPPIPMGAIGVPGAVPPPRDEIPEKPEKRRAGPHLRSAKEVLGYHIQAMDGEIGHVEDFVVDPKQWRIRAMVIDTRNWLPGKKVAIPPLWIDDVRWDERKVHVRLHRDEVKVGPEVHESAGAGVFRP